MYALVLCMLVVVGLVAYFIIKYAGPGASPASSTCASIDCEVSTWESYTPCTKRCDGRRNRTRDIVLNSDCGGEPCPRLYEEENCNIGCCLDCEVTFWSDWSPCSWECDGGTRRRNRTIVFENDNCGRPCPFLEDIMECNAQPCGEYTWRMVVSMFYLTQQMLTTRFLQLGPGQYKGCDSDADCPEGKVCSYNPNCAYHKCVRCSSGDDCARDEVCNCKDGKCFYFWGSPSAVGNTANKDVTKPLNVGGGITHAAAGLNYTAIVLEDGGAYASGYIDNYYQGQLGIRTDAVVLLSVNEFRLISQVYDRGDSNSVRNLRKNGSGRSRGSRRFLKSAPRFSKVFAGVKSTSY